MKGQDGVILVDRKYNLHYPSSLLNESSLLSQPSDFVPLCHTRKAETENHYLQGSLRRKMSVICYNKDKNPNISSELKIEAFGHLSTPKINKWKGYFSEK